THSSVQRSAAPRKPATRSSIGDGQHRSRRAQHPLSPARAGNPGSRPGSLPRQEQRKEPCRTGLHSPASTNREQTRESIATVSLPAPPGVPPPPPYLFDILES